MAGSEGTHSRLAFVGCPFASRTWATTSTVSWAVAPMYGGPPTHSPGLANESTTRGSSLKESWITLPAEAAVRRGASWEACAMAGTTARDTVEVVAQVL